MFYRVRFKYPANEPDVDATLTDVIVYAYSHQDARDRVVDMVQRDGGRRNQVEWVIGGTTPLGPADTLYYSEGGDLPKLH